MTTDAELLAALTVIARGSMEDVLCQRGDGRLVLREDADLRLVEAISIDEDGQVCHVQLHDRLEALSTLASYVCVPAEGGDVSQTYAPPPVPN